MKIDILNLSVVDLDESLIEKFVGEGVMCIKYCHHPTRIHVPEYMINDTAQLETCCKEYVQSIMDDISSNQGYIDIVVVQVIPEIEEIIGRLFMENDIQAIFLDVSLRSYESTEIKE